MKIYGGENLESPRMEIHGGEMIEKAHRCLIYDGDMTERRGMP